MCRSMWHHRGQSRQPLQLHTLLALMLCCVSVSDLRPYAWTICVDVHGLSALDVHGLSALDVHELTVSCRWSTSNCCIGIWLRRCKLTAYVCMRDYLVAACCNCDSVALLGHSEIRNLVQKSHAYDCDRVRLPCDF